MGILDHKYIENKITKNDGKDDVKYRWSHGATDKHLGDGLIIYSLIQFYKFKSLVCLGTGGGFIPRIMSQARYDLSEQGFYKTISHEWGDNGSTYVVDACNGVNGEVDWEDKDSFFRRQFNPKFIKETTETAYYEFFVKQNIKIDFLHIDANHTFEGVKKDFELYSQIMNEGGIITIHDTDKNYVDNFVEIKDHEGDDLSGPSEWLRRFTIGHKYDDYEVLNLFNYKEKSEHPTSSGLTIVRKK